MILIGSLLVVVGLVFLLKTDLYWKITEKWVSRGAEGPSAIYSIFVKASGILFIVMGLVVVIVRLVV